VSSPRQAAPVAHLRNDDAARYLFTTPEVVVAPALRLVQMARPLILRNHPEHGLRVAELLERVGGVAEQGAPQSSIPDVRIEVDRLQLTVV
jgi:hypothetical protein